MFLCWAKVFPPSPPSVKHDLSNSSPVLSCHGVEKSGRTRLPRSHGDETTRGWAMVGEAGGGGKREDTRESTLKDETFVHTQCAKIIRERFVYSSWCF